MYISNTVFGSNTRLIVKKIRIILHLTNKLQIATAGAFVCLIHCCILSTKKQTLAHRGCILNICGINISES